MYIIFHLRNTDKYWTWEVYHSSTDRCFLLDLLFEVAWNVIILSSFLLWLTCDIHISRWHCLKSSSVWLLHFGTVLCLWLSLAHINVVRKRTVQKDSFVRSHFWPLSKRQDTADHLDILNGFDARHDPDRL